MRILLSVTAMTPNDDTETPNNALPKEADKAYPSVKAEEPVPAMVITLAEASIIRIRKLPASATNKLPPPKVMPRGEENAAKVPCPLAIDAAPLPANVTTTPAAETRRTRLLLASATNISPVESAHTLVGPLKEAATPVPSENDALPLPARVDTESEVMFSTMRTFPNASTMAISPLGRMATDVG